MKLVPRT